jgi:hypothetical protein
VTGDADAGPDAAARRSLRDRRQAALARLWTKRDKCALCGERRWSLGDAVDLPLADAPGVAYRYVPVTCAACGHTHFVHAGVLDEKLAPER